MIYLILAFFLTGLVLLWVSRRQRGVSGLPAGRIIYADQKGWGKVEKPLYDAELHLTGKPDYLVEHGGEQIPVEVKSTRVSGAPYDAHIFQLAAYCLLVEHTYARRPTYGILRYMNRTFAIDYTSELEAELHNLITRIRELQQKKEVSRSHDFAMRCHRCGYKSICDQALH